MTGSMINAQTDQSMGCQCPACQKTLHASDCAVHNAPAYPVGECDCGAQPYPENFIDALKYDVARRDSESAQQEPPTVAELLCVCGAEWEWRNRDWELVATPPAQRTWVGLTDEEIDAIYSANGGTRTRRQIYQAIEAKLREKNT